MGVTGWFDSKPRARYEAKLFPTHIEIIDLFSNAEPTMSVTNDAERVVERVCKDFGRYDLRIMYRDTEGVWGELCHQKGVFKCFGSLDVFMDRDRALAALLGSEPTF